MHKTFSPSYLSRNPYSFCFRMKIPKDLQAALSKKELKYSLKTGNLSKAKAMARLLAGQIQLLFRKIRRGMNLTNDQILQIIKNYRDKLFQEYDQPARYDQYVDERDYHQYETDEDAVRETLTVLDWKKEEYNAKVHSGDYSDIEPIAAQLLAEEGIADADIDKASPMYGELCSGLLRAKIKGFEYQQEKLSGKYSDDLEKVLENNFPSPDLPQNPKQEPVKPPKTISQIMSGFFEKGEQEKKWTEKTKGEVESSMNLLVEFFGDVRIRFILLCVCSKYKKI